MPRDGTRDGKSRSIAVQCPRRRRLLWPLSFWAATPRRARRPCAAERKIRLQEALNSLEPVDREILALRHFEQLSNGETAQVLALDKSAASKRYARALIRLKDILATMPGGLGEI